MHRAIPLSMLLLLSLAAGDARADWVQFGVAVHCDRNAGTFALLPTVETDDGPSAIPAGATRVPVGQGQAFSCDLGTTRVEATLDVFPPQARGQGQGGGVIFLNRLAVGPRELVPNRLAFNWRSMDKRVLTRVLVKQASPVPVVDMCESDGWDWTNAYANEKCERTPVDGIAGFAGTWKLDLRNADQRARDVDCGLVFFDLHQAGEAITGTYSKSTVGCGRVDDDSPVRGLVDGNKAVLVIHSERNGEIWTGVAELRDGRLHWDMLQIATEGEVQGDALTLGEGVFDREEAAVE